MNRWNTKQENKQTNKGMEFQALSENLKWLKKISNAFNDRLSVLTTLNLPLSFHLFFERVSHYVTPGLLEFHICLNIPCTRLLPFAHSPSTLGLLGPAPCLTYNGEDDYHKIKNIPADGEIIMAEGDELQHALAGEQHNEHQVDTWQNACHIIALVIRFHHHGHHVQTDEDHDADVKHLSGYKVKDHSLKFVLRRNKDTFSNGGVFW